MSCNVPKNSYSKQETRKQNDNVASRTRSKTGHLDQNVGDRTRAKLQAICNSSGQGVFFPLYDIYAWGLSPKVSWVVYTNYILWT
jgi:hypothetical protein